MRAWLFKEDRVVPKGDSEEAKRDRLAADQGLAKGRACRTP
jgi:hypothetical protein